MRLPIPRLNVRQIMVFVVIAALAMEGVISMRRYQTAQHFRHASGCYFFGSDQVAMAKFNWREAMSLKYERAIWCPWQSLDPGVPEPK